ncbi:MAG TPA: hypothetical protein VKU40_12875 [Thermoanaerobaculia bacterium]|nr:hypothetical protein [Thermoanaerobaculia bacterium]
MKRGIVCVVALTALLAAACASEQDTVGLESTSAGMKMAAEYFTPQPVAAAHGSTEVEVRLRDGAVELPSSLPAGPTTFVVSNDGPDERGFGIAGRGIDRALAHPLAPGESGELEVELEAGTYFVSDRVGHGEEHGGGHGGGHDSNRLLHVVG